MGEAFQMVERKIILTVAAVLLLATMPASAQKIEISTDKKSYAKNGEIKVTVMVADEEGNPVETALTCAAYRIRRVSNPASAEDGYDARISYTDIFSMIEQKKPFRLANNKIMFISVGPNTNNAQDGALLVVNGMVLGQDASMIQYLNPIDVERINVSTDFVDIQRYTGFNTMGVIEIYTRTGKATKETDKASAKKSPEKPAIPAGGKLLYSSAELHTDSTGEAGFEFPAWKRATDVVIIVATAEPGTNPSSSRLTITVK